MNTDKFFASIRKNLFAGALKQSQVDGLNAILSATNEAGITDARFIAYMLATVYHETARTMQPTEEYGKGKGYDYGKKLKRTRKAYTKPDKLYYGRGYVQLTWFENYDTMGKLLGIDLLNQPELALDEKMAADIMIAGMLRGLFTGKKLQDYFNKDTDWINARRIINGLDKAELIAGYAKLFYTALQ